MALTDSVVELLQPRSLKHLSDKLAALVRGRLWAKVLVGMALGVGVGVLLGPTVDLVPRDVAATVASWLALPGQVFLGLVQMIVVPLVFASIIRGLVGSEDLEQLKRTGTLGVLFFLGTTTVSIGFGLLLALVVRPGRFLDPGLAREAMAGAQAPELPAASAGAPSSLPETLVGLLPTNPLGAMVNRDMLDVVIFSAIVGVALVTMSARHAKPLLELLGSVQEVCMTVVRWAMALAPVAVFGLMARLTASLGLESLLGMSAYVGTVLLGLLVLLAVFLAAIGLLSRKSPFAVLALVKDVLLLAFSTSSSAAVMPLTMRTAEEKLGVRPSVSQLIIPLGATLNMNGTALYQGVATVFLAQVFGIDLSPAQLLLVVVTAVAASIGSPATPGVGIVILSMVLSSAGVPVAGIALLMGVDRILDMTRTTVNVGGDLLAAVLLDRLVHGGTSAEEQLVQERARQALRESTGEDVLERAPSVEPALRPG